MDSKIDKVSSDHIQIESEDAEPKEDDTKNEEPQQLPATSTEVCFMCRSSMAGAAQLTMDKLSTVVTKISVREKVEHETGCQLSSFTKLPRGICSSCYQVVNEIDVLEHRLSVYRNYLSANVHASVSGLGKSKTDENSQLQVTQNSVDIVETETKEDSSSVSSDHEINENIEQKSPGNDNISEKVAISVSDVNVDTLSKSSPNLPNVSITQDSPIPLTSKAETIQSEDEKTSISNNLNAPSTSSFINENLKYSSSNNIINCNLLNINSPYYSPVHYASPLSSPTHTSSHQTQRIYPLSPLHNYAPIFGSYSLALPPHSSPYYMPYPQQSPCNLSVVAPLQSPNTVGVQSTAVGNTSDNTNSVEKVKQEKTVLKKSEEEVTYDSKISSKPLDCGSRDDEYDITKSLVTYGDKTQASNFSNCSVPLPLISPIAYGLSGTFNNTPLLSPDWHAQFSSALDGLDVSNSFVNKFPCEVVPVTSVEGSALHKVSPLKSKDTLYPSRHSYFIESTDGVSKNESDNCQNKIIPDTVINSELINNDKTEISNASVSNGIQSQTMPESSCSKILISPIPTLVAMLSPSKIMIKNHVKESTVTCNSLKQTITHSFSTDDNLLQKCNESNSVAHSVVSGSNSVSYTSSLSKSDSPISDLKNEILLSSTEKETEDISLAKEKASCSNENSAESADTSKESNSFHLSEEISKEIAGECSSASFGTSFCSPVSLKRRLRNGLLKSNPSKSVMKTRQSARNTNPKRITRSQSKSLVSNISVSKRKKKIALSIGSDDTVSPKYNLRSRLPVRISNSAEAIPSSTASNSPVGETISFSDNINNENNSNKPDSITKHTINTTKKERSNDYHTNSISNVTTGNTHASSSSDNNSKKMIGGATMNTSVKSADTQSMDHFGILPQTDFPSSVPAALSSRSTKAVSAKSYGVNNVTNSNNTSSNNNIINNQNYQSSTDYYSKQYTPCNFAPQNYNNALNSDLPIPPDNSYYGLSRDEQSLHNVYECNGSQNSYHQIGLTPNLATKEQNNGVSNNSEGSSVRAMPCQTAIPTQSNSKSTLVNKLYQEECSYDSRNVNLEMTHKWVNQSHSYTTSLASTQQNTYSNKAHAYSGSDNILTANNVNCNFPSGSNHPPTQTNFNNFPQYLNRNVQNIPGTSGTQNSSHKTDIKKKSMVNNTQCHLNKKDAAINKIFNRNYMHSYSYQNETPGYGFNRQTRKSQEVRPTNGNDNNSLRTCSSSTQQTATRNVPFTNKNGSSEYPYVSNINHATNSKNNIVQPIADQTKPQHKANYNVTNLGNNCVPVHTNHDINSHNYPNRYLQDNSQNYIAPLQNCNQFTHNSSMPQSMNHDRPYMVNNMPNNFANQSFNHIPNLNNNMVMHSSNYIKPNLVNNNQSINSGHINNFPNNSNLPNRSYPQRGHNVTTRNLPTGSGMVLNNAIEHNMCHNNNLPNVNPQMNVPNMSTYHNIGPINSERLNMPNASMNRHMTKSNTAPNYNSPVHVNPLVNQSVHTYNHQMVRQQQNQRRYIPQSNNPNNFMNSQDQIPLHMNSNQYNSSMQPAQNINDVNHLNNYADANHCHGYIDQSIQYNSHNNQGYVNQTYADGSCIQGNALQPFNEFHKPSKHNSQTQTMEYPCNIVPNQMYQQIDSTPYGSIANHSSDHMRLNYPPEMNHNSIKPNANQTNVKIQTFENHNSQNLNSQIDQNINRSTSNNPPSEKTAQSIIDGVKDRSCENEEYNKLNPFTCDPSAKLDGKIKKPDTPNNNDISNYKKEVPNSSEKKGETSPDNEKQSTKDDLNIDEHCSVSVQSNNLINCTESSASSTVTSGHQECSEIDGSTHTNSSLNPSNGNIEFSSTPHQYEDKNCTIDSNEKLCTDSNLQMISKLERVSNRLLGDADIDIEMCDHPEDELIINDISDNNVTSGIGHKSSAGVSDVSSHCLEFQEKDESIASIDNEIEEQGNLDDAASLTETFAEAISVTESAQGDFYFESDSSAHPSVAQSPALQDNNVSIPPSPVNSSVSFNRPMTPDNLRHAQEATEYLKPTLLVRNFKSKKHAKLQTCRQCDQVFSTRQCLVRHIERRHRTSTYSFSCDICNKKMLTERALNRHKQIHENHTCKLCNDVFSLKSQLKQHLKEHAASRLSCPHCNMECTSIQALISHTNSHLREKPVHKCSECDKVFANNRNLVVHKRIHSGERPHKCSNCDRCFSVKSNMISHREICLGQCKFNCNICNRGFPLESLYLRHMEEHEGKYSHVCNVCQKGFSKPSGLKDHMKVHHKKKKTSCNVCNIQFPTPAKLKSHMKTHYNKVSKKVTCPLCSKTLARAEHLNDHFARHSNKRNHVCSFCSKAFFYKCNLRGHVSVMHMGVKKHKCPQCSKQFGSKYNLNIHLSTHSGVKPHECLECGKKFATKPNFKKHLKCHVTSAVETTKSS